MRKGFTLIELMIVIAIIAIIAAIAIPNLLESRVTANESAASASLKAGIFAGQVQFQGGGYQDKDQDNVGEYATLKMLSGINSTNKISAGNLRLLTGPLSVPGSWGTGDTAALARGVSNGFFFTGVAPSETSDAEVTIGILHDGLGTAGASAALSLTTSTANNGEQSWCAACVPQEWGNTGRRIFTVGQDGQVRSPANAAVQDAIYSSLAGANGAKPAVSALGVAIATCMSAALATATTAFAITTMDGANYNGFPVYSK